MEKSDVEAAVSLYRSGSRPFNYRKPDWFFRADDGLGYPLKYIYSMAIGVAKPPDTRTADATRDMTNLGYQVFSLANDEEIPLFELDKDGGELVKHAESRLRAEQLRQVTADHLWAAVQKLLKGSEAPGFGPSVDYDLLVQGGARLAPKQVFGLAATSALGFPVGPAHFHGGLNTICFQILEAAGYTIVAKGQQPAGLDDLVDPEEKVWLEGSMKLVSHFRRERSPGLAQAKKASFLKQHGTLYCEQCLLDPIKAHGKYGEACIEVHHDAVSISDMGENHATTLDQLRCLCANCHRVLHRALKDQTNIALPTAVA